MNNQDAQEYVQHRLADFIGTDWSSLVSDPSKLQVFVNRVNNVVEELLRHHNFVVVSDFSKSFRFSGVVFSDGVLEYTYSRFK